MNVIRHRVSAPEIDKSKKAYLASTKPPVDEAGLPPELLTAIEQFSADLDNRRLVSNSEQVFAHAQRFLTALGIIIKRNLTHKTAEDNAHDKQFFAEISSLVKKLRYSKTNGQDKQFLAKLFFQLKKQLQKEKLTEADNRKLQAQLMNFSMERISVIDNEICNLIKSIFFATDIEIKENWHETLDRKLGQLIQSIYSRTGQNLFAGLFGSQAYGSLPIIAEVVKLAKDEAVPISEAQRTALINQLTESLQHLIRANCERAFIRDIASLSSNDPLKALLIALINTLNDKALENTALKQALLEAVQASTKATHDQALIDIPRDHLFIVQGKQKSCLNLNCETFDKLRTSLIEQCQAKECELTSAQTDAILLMGNQATYHTFSGVILTYNLLQKLAKGRHINIRHREAQLSFNAENKLEKIAFHYFVGYYNPDDNEDKGTLGIAVVNVDVSKVAYLQPELTGFPGCLSNCAVDVEYFSIDKTVDIILPSSIKAVTEEVELLDYYPVEAYPEAMESILAQANRPTVVMIEAANDNPAIPQFQAKNTNNRFIAFLKHNAVALSLTLGFGITAASVFLFAPQLSILAIFFAIAASITSIDVLVNVTSPATAEAVVTNQQPAVTTTGTVPVIEGHQVEAHLQAEEAVAVTSRTNEPVRKTIIEEPPILSNAMQRLNEQEERDAKVNLLDMVKLFTDYFSKNKIIVTCKNLNKLTLDELNQELASYLAGIQTIDLIAIFDSISPKSRENKRKYFISQVFKVFKRLNSTIFEEFKKGIITRKMDRVVRLFDKEEIGNLLDSHAKPTRKKVQANISLDNTINHSSTSQQAINEQSIKEYT